MTLAKTFLKSWNLGRTLAFLLLFYLNFGRFVPFFFFGSDLGERCIPLFNYFYEYTIKIDKNAFVGISSL